MRRGAWQIPTQRKQNYHVGLRYCTKERLIGCCARITASRSGLADLFSVAHFALLILPRPSHFSHVFAGKPWDSVPEGHTLTQMPNEGELGFVPSRVISAAKARSGKTRFCLPCPWHTDHDWTIGVPTPESTLCIGRVGRTYGSTPTFTLDTDSKAVRSLCSRGGRTQHKCRKERLFTDSLNRKAAVRRKVRHRIFMSNLLTQVPDHSVLVIWSAVILAERVEDASRTYQTLGKVPKNVNADSVSALEYVFRRYVLPVVKQRAWLV